MHLNSSNYFVFLISLYFHFYFIINYPLLEKLTDISFLSAMLSGRYCKCHLLFYLGMLITRPSLIGLASGPRVGFMLLLKYNLAQPKCELVRRFRYSAKQHTSRMLLKNVYRQVPKLTIEINLLMTKKCAILKLFPVVDCFLRYIYRHETLGHMYIEHFYQQSCLVIILDRFLEIFFEIWIWQRSIHMISQLLLL